MEPERGRSTVPSPRRALHHSLAARPRPLAAAGHRPTPRSCRAISSPGARQPRPGLECCAPAARHRETGAHEPITALIAPWPRPAPPPPHRAGPGNPRAQPARRRSPAPPALQNPKGQSHSHSASTLRERGVSWLFSPGEWRFQGWERLWRFLPRTLEQV